MREYQYSVSVMIITINGGMDDDRYAIDISYIGRFQDMMMTTLSESYLAHLK